MRLEARRGVQFLDKILRLEEVLRLLEGILRLLGTPARAVQLLDKILRLGLLEPPSPTSTCGSDALDDLVPSLFIFGLEAIFGLLEAILRLLEGILRLLEAIFGKFCFAQKLLRNARLCKIEYLIF